jgi:uncharacterized membrane protein YcaP (DUF421 family)
VDIDVVAILQPDSSPLELILRGTVTYLSVFVLLRVIVKQATGGLNLADLLLIVMVADAAQNAMAGEYTSVADGLILVATLAFWSLLIDWLSVRVDFVGRFVHPPARQIVRDGQELKREMRKEMITHEELMTYVREAGAETIDRVKHAWVEGNGEISVVLQEGEPHANHERRAV